MGKGHRTRSRAPTSTFMADTLVRIGVSLILLASLCGTSPGQVERSALTGVVYDQSGHRIPHATVSATDLATNMKRETETTSQGTYELLDLPAGMFTFQISKPGFSTFSADHVEQIVGHTRTLNATLAVASGKQQTSVTEPLVQVDRVDATIGAPVEQEQINELPINGRNWATLTALVPGQLTTVRAINVLSGSPGTAWTITTCRSTESMPPQFLTRNSANTSD